MNRQVFKNIPIDLNIEGVYRRLGFWDDATLISDRQREEIDSMMYEALEYLSFSAVAVRQPIAIKTDDYLQIANGLVLKSKNLASVFAQADELLFMGATAGLEIMDKVYELSDDDLTKATVFNTVSGEMVDDVFDWLMSYYRRLLRRDMLSVTKNRYSAGYGDFLLEQQKDIFELLKFDELGVSISPSSFMLKPEKSVTAIAGIIKK